jgi:hypothetical protein
VVIGEGRDIVIGEICIPASLNINNLEKTAVLHFPLLWQGVCQSQPTDKHFRKSNCVASHLAYVQFFFFFFQVFKITFIKLTCALQETNT